MYIHFCNYSNQALCKTSSFCFISIELERIETAINQTKVATFEPSFYAWFYPFQLMDSFNFKDYGSYFEQDFRHRWLRPLHLVQKLSKFKRVDDLLIQVAGGSVEGRDIYTVKWGSGPIKILCWTQMHGNEPTATMAVIDLLNFLTSQDKYDELRELLKTKLQITFVPMLNPDGAEAFTRRNALGIDPNRDALVQQTPEIQTLLKVVEELKPDWCFNLHDQRNIFSVGDTKNTATISFLAASADIAKTLTPTRQLAMSLIGIMNEALNDTLPGKIGKYTDEYYHRALGEHFHKNEIPCVLIESGAYKGDPTRDRARQANFLALIKAFETIAKGKLDTTEIERYLAIPQNTTNMLDLVIRDCEVSLKGQTIKMDIGLLYEEKPNFDTNQLERYFILNDLGDLQYQFGIEEERGGLLDTPYQDLKLGAPANFIFKMKNNTVLEFINGIQQ